MRSIKRIVDTYNKIATKYVDSLLRKYLNKKVYFPIRYTIFASKNRFRSSIPFLLSENKTLGKVIGAVGEIIWASILILDDIGDEDVIRRGQPTAWRKFGLLQALHSAILGLEISKQILKDHKINTTILSSLEKSFWDTIKAQIEQSYFLPLTSSSRVLQNYKEKNSLTRWLISAAIKNNRTLGKKEKSVIFSVLLNLSWAAQIKNDLQDILYHPSTSRCLRDIRHKLITYPITVFFQKASSIDKQRFIKKVWGKEENLDKLQRCVISLFKKYKIFDICLQKISGYLENSINNINKINNKPIRAYFHSFVEMHRNLVPENTNYKFIGLFENQNISLNYETNIYKQNSSHRKIALGNC